MHIVSQNPGLLSIDQELVCEGAEKAQIGGGASVYQDQIRDRCPIGLELFDAAIGFVEDCGYYEVHQALGWHVSRFWQRKPHNFGVTAAFVNEDGLRWQFKPEFATLKKDGTLDKYLAAVGVGSRAFLPAIPPSTRQIISQRYGVEFPSEGSFWDFVESRPELTIAVTEGGFKALAALNLGYICISLYGVNAGVSKYETIAGERIRKLKPELIADLARFAVEGRRFVLAFDQDTAYKTRAKVSAAMADLSWHLEQAGASAEIATWDGEQGQFKGLDDLIFGAGADAWHSAFNAAIPANQWRIQNELARAVKRKPDLYISDREFSEVADQLPKSGLVVLHGGKGTGKSKAIGTMLGDRPWLSSTPLISLGRDQAQSWGGVFINDGDLLGDRLLKDGAPVNGASVCVPSLLKVQRIKHEVLVIDETTAHLEFLLNSRLANKQGIRPLLIAEHQRQAQYAELVILADADLTEEAIVHYEEMTGHRAYLVRSDRQALPYKSSILDCKQPEAIAALQQRIDALEVGKLLYINTDSKTLADALAKLLEGMGIKSLLITSDTSGGDDQARFLTSKGAMIPELQAQGIQAIISSPTIAQGFSIERHTDQIDSVWGFYTGGSITAHAIAQSLDRVRSNDVPRFVHVAKKGAAYSKLSKAQTIAAFTKEFGQLSTAAARLARLSLSPEAIAKSDGIDWQGSNIKMLAALEVRRNRGMGQLRDTVIALLCHEGKRVMMVKPLITKVEALTAGRQLSQASKAIRLAHAEAVANAEALTEVNADRLSNQTEALTPDQILSLTKHRLSQFYRTDVDADLVMFDRSGATQAEIKALERLLNSQLATDRTAGTINRNASTPQDWSRAAVRSWLYEKSGLGDLAQSIVAGEVVEVSPDAMALIALFVRGHCEEFRLAFGFTKLDEISDRQIIGQMLRANGIRTKRNRRKGTYSVDTAALAVVLAIIEKRKQCDPPPLNIGLDQGGGSHQNTPGLSASVGASARESESDADLTHGITIEYPDGSIEYETIAA
jgi:Domain of unknown function (DUF3854)